MTVSQSPLITTAQGLGSNNIMCIVADRNGGIWIGTDGGGATRFDGKTFATYTTAPHI